MGAYDSILGSGVGGATPVDFSNAIRKLAVAYKRVGTMDAANKLKLKWAEETHKMEMAKSQADLALQAKRIEAIQFERDMLLQEKQKQEDQEAATSAASKRLTEAFTGLQEDYQNPEARAGFNEALVGFAGVKPRTAQEMTNLLTNFGKMVTSLPAAEQDLMYKQLGNALRQKALMAMPDGMKPSDQKIITEMQRSAIDYGVAEARKSLDENTVEEMDADYKATRDMLAGGLSKELGILKQQMIMAKDDKMAEAVQKATDGALAGDLSGVSSLITSMAPGAEGTQLKKTLDNMKLAVDQMVTEREKYQADVNYARTSERLWNDLSADMVSNYNYTEGAVGSYMREKADILQSKLLGMRSEIDEVMAGTNPPKNRSRAIETVYARNADQFTKPFERRWVLRTLYTMEAERAVSQRAFEKEQKGTE
jgi:hypothetical protein